MTLYRGPGGTGSATSDADTTLYQDFLNQTIAARDAALQAEINAELAETNAETAETNAETAETNAETAAAAAASSASAAASSASSASTSASNASTSASAASTSATNAASSASSASSSSSAASTSASNAATSATNASNSASSASTSATNAANSASTATTQATNSASSATAAASSASAASTSATNAANSASSASTSATNAANSATSAAASATAAAASAASIDPATLVRLTGDQTIGGTKTFTSTISGSITGNAGTVTNGVYTTGDQTIAGTKTFSSNPILSAGTVNGLAFLNASKVLTTGSALTFDGTNLGVGNSSPANAITVGTTSAGKNIAIYSSSNGNNGLLRMYDLGGTERLQLSANSTGEAVYYAPTGSVHAWYINSEQMRLTSTGLGIGTSSPSTKLHVSGQSRFADSSNASNYITLGAGANAPYGNASISTTTAGLAIVAEGAGNITFRNNGSEAMRIDTANNLGLGVTPSAWGYRTALQIGSGGSLAAFNGGASYASNVEVSGNSFLNSSASRRYIASDYATLYRQESGVHAWYTAPSGTAGNAISFTQAMTLDASGNLGIGTSSWSTSKLYVLGNTTNYGITSEAPNGYGSLNLKQTSGNTMSIGMASNGLFIYDSNAGSTRLTLDSSGNLLVGNTSRASSERLSVWGTGANDLIFADTPSGGTGYVYRTNTSSGLAAYFITSAGQAGLISCSGTTTSYNSGSDYRLKDNVRPLTGALETVAKLKPVAFEWKHDGSYGDSFLAHELAEVCPAAVTGEKDAVDAEGNPRYQGIDTSFLVATLTAALQEAHGLIKTLEQRVAALEAK